MSDAGDISILIAIVCTFILGLTAGVSISHINDHREAVEAGVAYYNPTNKIFTWKTNLVEKESKNE